MKFNVKNCKVIHFGNNNVENEYFMNGKKLEIVTEEKDLGVWTDKTMKPSKQCETAANTANRILGQISRAFHYRKKSNLVPLYKTFVRPKLEYAVAAWNPWLGKDIAILERVQERLIKMISNVKGESYEEKLTDAGLTTLKERRERGDMIETFKVMKGLCRANKNEWFNIQTYNDMTRATRTTTSVTEQGQTRREDIIFREHVRLETRKNFFCIRVTQNWNEIPDEIRNQKSINGFKNSYDKWIIQKKQAAK